MTIANREHAVGRSVSQQKAEQKETVTDFQTFVEEDKIMQKIGFKADQQYQENWGCLCKLS